MLQVSAAAASLRKLLFFSYFSLPIARISEEASALQAQHSCSVCYLFESTRSSACVCVGVRVAALGHADGAAYAISAAHAMKWSPVRRL